MRFLLIPFCSLVALAISTSLIEAAEESRPVFEPQTIDDRVQIGYGTAIGDVDGDGKPDLLLADKSEFVWYRNPTWEKFVLTKNLTARDNVCIAARDIDGDGKVEVAVGAQWNPGDTQNSGSVHYLAPTQDRTKPWRPIQLHHEPVVHRMRWVKLADQRFVLVVAPLHGRGNRNGEGEGVKLLAYEAPADVDQPWSTTLLDDSLHVTHNFDLGQWNSATPAEEIAYIGKEGAMLISFAENAWSKQRFPRIEGGGEIRMGRLSSTQPFLVTIEPFHGDKLVYYPAGYQGSSGELTAVRDRIVLDDRFRQGHAIAVADLFGNGRQQIVAGWRAPNQDGKVGVKLYYPVDQRGMRWASMPVDDNQMAAEDLRVGDLDGDGRPEIVAAGRATNNLKIYWNRAPRKP